MDKKLEDYLYYHEPGPPDIKIYHGDCLEVIPLLEKVNLVVTSPPYNMGGVSLGYQPNSKVGQSHYGEYGDNKKESDYEKWILEIIRQLLVQSKYVFWNMQYVVSTKKTIHSIMREFESNMKDIFIWRKQAVSQICVKRSPILANGYEFVFLMGQDGTKIFKDSNFPENGYVPNIKEWYRTETFDEHHATYEKRLPAYFIEYFTKPQSLILDPFLGSGTTLVACKELKRNGIGIEINEKYCQIAKKRLMNTQVPFI